MPVRSRLFVVPCYLLALLAAAPAHADVKAGVDAWTKGDFGAAVAEWNGPAARGDADAQFNLAQAYKLGRGVKQDLARAEELFGQAAGKGHLQASDNYGLLLFQRGERAMALPFISAASDRGDPRAQYLLGIASFNGDNVPKDWVRAYALVSLAQQAGLAQANSALTQMDQHIPLEQRQRSVALAQELKTQADATRARQLAAADLGSSLPNTATNTPPNTPQRPVVTAQPRVPPAVAAARVPTAAQPGHPRDAGADYARPPVPAPRPVVVTPAPRPPVAVVAAPRPVVAARVPASADVAAPAGAWRVQLGAFGVAANAEALWNRVKGRPEVSGRTRLLVPAGRVTKLQAGGYASQAAAESACSRLAAAGFACLAVRN